ncbi:FtsX-like permease family protein [Micromonospora sp. WP24]|uniref:FtsX-like permease family protein n=1 Tax=Micromonospora sp. WP24 TaxID=2604469 RepID=UPI0011D467F0|nr:FtsX-like permease family protein [Micromonospora sp. WP24]TYB97298.1 FtsX-like permease family protein [Micromonospora sp. WP24]
MSIGAVVRRIRAYGGQFLLLGVLTLVITLLVSGVPRVANRLTEQGLRQHLATQLPAKRDITYTIGQSATGSIPSSARAGQSRLDVLQESMPVEVRDTVAERWYVADTPSGRLTGPDLKRNNLLVDLGLRAMPTVPDAATLVDGRWPAEDVPRDAPTQIALSEETARKLDLRVGSELRLALPGSGLPTASVVVVGIFAPNDRAGGVWDSLPQLLRAAEPLGDGEPFIAVGLTTIGALDQRAADGWPLAYSWRYRVSPDAVDAKRLDATIDELQRLERTLPAGMKVVQGVDVPLREFRDGLASARTLLAVIAAGVLATLAGLVILAAGLAARRRRAEFALVRARGGGSTTVARRTLAESLLVTAPAAAVGWLLGTLVPGAPDPTGPYAVLATVLVALTLPVAALGTSGGADRRDLVRLRPSARRLTVEGSLLVLAGLAVVLLRRRGLTLGEVDPLLVAVPVLLAMAVAVLVLRLYPWPLRLVGRLAARARGSVAFLGTARAGRSMVATPLVVVVLAIATAGFCAVVSSGIESSRDRAAAERVPGDALVTGDRLAPDTAAALSGLPGVRAVAALIDDSGRPARSAAGLDAGIGQVDVLAVDGPALARVGREAGRHVSVPPVLNTGASAGPLPALVSPAVAADLARAGLNGSAFIPVQGQRYEFRVAGTVESFPLVTPGAERFVVLPLQALPQRPTDAVPTGFVVAGDAVASEALRRTGDEGQQRYQSGGVVSGGARPLGVEVQTWAGTRRLVGEGGANGLLAFGFVSGATGGTLLGLLAIAFTVLAGARSRGQVLSRLRTLGLSRRQWRGMLLLELAPLVCVAVFTGAFVGALLPLLLTPLLGLSAFTSGVPVQVAFEPGLVAAVVALGALALGFAVAIEALNNRRLRLGEVLRLGEES